MNYIRNFLFYFVATIWTALVGVLFLPTILFKDEVAVAKVIRIWAIGVMYMLNYICGIVVHEEGLENIPNENFIVASAHQSAFETVFFLTRFKYPVFVLKRELCLIPIYGWYLRPSGMIVIDRSNKFSVISIQEASKKAISKHRPVIIFPEGTRVNYGQKGVYKSGIYGIFKASNGSSVLPVALDSGRLWSKSSPILKPGIVHVKYLPVISEDKGKSEFMQTLQQTIQKEDFA